MINLAEALDELAGAERVFLTESPAEIVVAQADAGIADDILGRVRALGWQVRVENAATEEVLAALDPAFEPFRITITKPVVEGRTRLLTLSGFSDWLSGNPSGIVQVARCSAPFITGLFRVDDWLGHADFEPAQRSKSPRLLVRETQQQRVVPDDVRAWLSEEASAPDWDEPTFRIWARKATLACLMSVATEVNAGADLTFRGTAQLTIQQPDPAYVPTERQFWHLQRTVSWVYENPSETETRFRLINYELGRLGRSANVAIQDVLEYVGIALESAKLAFQYSLAKISSDTAKSLSDLRKSLSEETARLSEIVRQVTTAVSGTIFIGIGLVAARFSTDTPPIALFVMGLVLCGYVGLIIYSGYKQITYQREMRIVWRERLYGYISNDDYKRMILDPAGKSESQFHSAALIGGAVTLIIFLAIILSVSL